MITESLATVNVISATMDQLANTHGYADITPAMLQSTLGINALITSWGGNITISDAPTINSYNIVITNTPMIVCQILRTKITYNNKYSIVEPPPYHACRGPTSDFIYSYNNNNY